jgi:hypothetical protein
MKKSFIDEIISVVVFLLLLTTFIPFGYAVQETFKFDRGRAEGYVAYIVNSWQPPEQEVVQVCDGSGFITHGDGHKTPCPGCDQCKGGQVAPPQEAEPQEAEPQEVVVPEPERVVKPEVKKKGLFFRGSSKKSKSIPSRAAQSYGSKYYERQGW